MVVWLAKNPGKAKEAPKPRAKPAPRLKPEPARRAFPAAAAAVCTVAVAGLGTAGSPGLGRAGRQQARSGSSFGRGHGAATARQAPTAVTTCQGRIRTAVHCRRTPPPLDPPPPLLPFQCRRLTAKILLRSLRCQDDLSLKNFGPPSAGTIGGPWEEGFWVAEWVGHSTGVPAHQVGWRTAGVRSLRGETGKTRPEWCVWRGCIRRGDLKGGRGRVGMRHIQSGPGQ